MNNLPSLLSLITAICCIIISFYVIRTIRRRHIRDEEDEMFYLQNKTKERILFNKLKMKGKDRIMSIITATINPYVIVRTFSAGVHAGFLVKRDGMEVTLENSRRIRYWDGAFTLSELAHVGPTKPDKCEFSIELPSILLLEAIEIIPTTPESEKIIRSIDPYVPSSIKEDN